MTALAVAGWLCSAALAVVLAQGRQHAMTRARHLARVAHELRGPLHAAGMVLYSVRRQAAAGAPTLPALAALEIELGRLALAVGDLQARPARRAVAFSRTTPTDPMTCDVAALVRALAPGWEAQAAAAGRTVTVAVPSAATHAAGHKLRLAQALGNLVANALEHGAGDVSVLVRAAPDATIVVEVTDGGPGLPAAVATLIAQPGDPRSRRGHGLAIIAAIAENAGGALAAGPAARGARLVLSLPVASGDRLRADPRGSAPVGLLVS